jgi:hypothetical protein
VSGPEAERQRRHSVPSDQYSPDRGSAARSRYQQEPAHNTDRSGEIEWNDRQLTEGRQDAPFNRRTSTSPGNRSRNMNSFASRSNQWQGNVSFSCAFRVDAVANLDQGSEDSGPEESGRNTAFSRAGGDNSQDTSDGRSRSTPSNSRGGKSASKDASGPKDMKQKVLQGWDWLWGRKDGGNPKRRDDDDAGGSGIAN